MATAGVNGEQPDFNKPIVNPAVLQILERTLADAKAGKIISAAVIVTNAPNTVGVQQAGGFLFEINMGCDILKNNIFAASQKNRGSLLRA